MLWIWKWCRRCPEPSSDVCPRCGRPPADQPDGRFPYLLNHNDKRLLKAIGVEFVETGTDRRPSPDPAGSPLL